MPAVASLTAGDSLSIDGLYESAIDHYTEAICLTDDRHTPDNSDDVMGGAERRTVRFLALSHRSSAHASLDRYRAAYIDAKEALSLIDINRYDFQTTGGGKGSSNKKLRCEQVALCHDRCARALMAVREADSEGGDERSVSEARSHWENAVTLAGMADDSNLVDRYQKCLERLAASTCVDADERETNDRTNEMVEKTPKQAETTNQVSTTSTTPAPSSSNSATQTPKYQYYQDESWMKIQILEANLTPETCTVSVTPDSLTVTVLKNNVTYTVVHGDLCEKVLPERCRTIYKDEKVLIKLKKVEGGEWYSLFDDKKKRKSVDKEAKKDTKSSAEKDAKGEDGSDNHAKQCIPRPYASTKDWNAIDRDLKAAEESEKPEGEEALNKLFQQIYANANEDTRRAMIKSMQTSGGTVLSTNWDEVSKADYEKERVAPKGMEWKNYEGDKLRMKEDD